MDLFEPISNKKRSMVYSSRDKKINLEKNLTQEVVQDSEQIIVN